MATKGLDVPAPVAFLRDRFGGDFDTIDNEVSIPTTGKQLVGGDPEAVALTIINLGSDTVFVRPKAPASATDGIPLSPNGSVSLTVRDDGPLPTYDWYAAANTGNQNVYYLRLSRYNKVEQA